MTVNRRTLTLYRACIQLKGVLEEPSKYSLGISLVTIAPPTIPKKVADTCFFSHYVDSEYNLLTEYCFDKAPSIFVMKALDADASHIPLLQVLPVDTNLLLQIFSPTRDYVQKQIYS